MASELKYKKEEFEQSQIKNDESENQVKKLQVKFYYYHLYSLFIILYIIRVN